MEEFRDLPITPPHGGWSLLLDTKKLDIPPEQLADRLLKQVKVVATPMSGWGQSGRNYLRFVFSNEPKERLIGIGEKLKKCL